ncbi:MAG: amino acid adenylation domain-containing protein [Pseudomonadales bacterium]|nr:amino acid adenylation domain-containing protein [Pseudomonadales bacterium]
MAFNLTTGPLLRVHLIKLKPDHYWLHLCLHHIIADGWSMSVLLDELAHLYRHHSSPNQSHCNEGNPGTAERSAEVLPELPLQYADYTLWQRETLAGENMKQQLQYWREQLHDAPQTLNLPLDNTRQPDSPDKAAHHQFLLTNSETHQLQQFALHHDASPFMVAYCAFNCFLSRISGQNDIVTGTVVANREAEDLEKLIGFFVNTLAIRSTHHPEDTFNQALQQFKNTLLSAYGHQDMPFEKVVEALQPNRELGQTPLFQVLFVFQNTPALVLDLQGLTVKPLDLDASDNIRFDLEIYSQFDASNDGRLRFDFFYQTALFNRRTIERMAEQYNCLLTHAIKVPEVPVSQLKLCSETTQFRLQQGLSSPKDLSSTRERLEHKVHQSVVENPNAIAVTNGEDSITYLDLERKSDQVAQYLLHEGVNSEDPIAVCLTRDTDLIVVLLGILKAGACYVPLDPEYPASRLYQILEDCEARYIFVEPSTEDCIRDIRSQAMGSTARGHLFWNAIQKQTALSFCANPLRTNNVSVDQLAYIIYTSGSTGRPKGVAIEHRSAAALIDWAREQFDNNALSRVLASTSICFDLSVFEIFVTLSAGGTVILVDNALACLERKTVEQQTGNFPPSLNPSLINTVPSAIRSLLDANAIPETVQTINLAGEPLGQDLVDRLYRLPHITKVYDLYGPSEDTTYSTFKLRTKGGRAAIGLPIAGTTAYVVDQSLNVVPEGVCGELLLGGEGLARGYFKRPELTAEKFINNPFTPEHKNRLYRTGDLVRVNSDNELEYLGRIDQQIKIRGFRVELGEIEYQLNQLAEINSAVVTVLADHSGNKTILAAYLVPEQINDPLDMVAIEAEIRKRLPNYMVPSRYCQIASIPLSPNGKTDRKALPEFSLQTSSETHSAPRSPLDHLLCDLWSEILGLTAALGIDDNFFQLGGHSLLAAQITNRLNTSQFNQKQLECYREINTPDIQASLSKLSVRALFENPTIRLLSDALSANTQQVKDENSRADQYTISHFPEPSPKIDNALYPLSPGQQRLWFLHQFPELQNAYNVFMAVHIRGPLQIQSLQNAVSNVVRKHSILRTRFIETEDGPKQQLLDDCDVKLEIIDLRDEYATDPDSLNRALNQLTSQRFELERGPLLSLSLLDCSDTEVSDGFSPHYVLAFVMHHIISDGWSLGILFDELKRGYQASEAARQSATELADKPETTLPIQYADYALYTQDRETTNAYAEQLDYWKSRLAGYPDLLNYPFDYPRLKSGDARYQAKRGGTIHFDLDRQVVDRIKSLAHARNSSVFMVALSIYAALLYRYTRQPRLIIGTPVANRNHPALEKLIGFFVNTLPICFDLDSNQSLNQLQAQTRDTLLDAFSHQEVPFNKVVEALNLSGNQGYNPLIQTLFMMHNAPVVDREIPDIEITPVKLEQQSAMFDLMMSLTESEGQIQGIFSYDLTLISKHSAEHFVQYYVRLLSIAVQEPEKALGQIELRDCPHLPPSRLPVKPANLVRTPSRSLLVDQIEAAIAQFSNRTALQAEQDYTYGEIGRQSDRLLRWLTHQGIREGQSIALWLPRRGDLFIWKLACLRGGIAYVPILPDCPIQRANQIILNAQCALLVIDSEKLETLLENTAFQVDCSVVNSDEREIWLAAESKLNTQPHHGARVSTEATGYILHTSGSTGTPKGVAVPHTVLGNLVEWHQQQPRLSKSARTLQFASPGFDVCFQEIATTWCTGGTLIICPDEIRIDSAALFDFIKAKRIERVFLPYVALQALCESAQSEFDHQQSQSLPLLDDVITAGEQLKITDPIRAFFASNPVCRLHNHYGPTETHVITALQLPEKSETWPRLPSIGTALNHVELTVVDPDTLVPQPEGIPGELWVSGDCLASGYVNQPALTKQRFIRHALQPDQFKRFYRTGDLVRSQGDGQFTYLSRIDQQVKIRGFRVEPGETEAVISGYPGIRDCAVVAKTIKESPVLVGYIGGFPREQEQALTSNLKNWLQERLPDYQIPTIWVYVAEFPKTTSGKLDRKKLPVPVQTNTIQLHEHTYTNPDNAPLDASPDSKLESQILQIWRKILPNAEALKVTDNFFEAGGHSLLATRLINRIRFETGISLSVKTLFEHPSVRALTQALGAEQAGQSDVHPGDSRSGLTTIPRHPRDSAVPLSYAQERLWFLHQLEPDSSRYNMSVAFQIDGLLRVSSLSRAVEHIVEKHEALRTNFRMDGETPFQVIQASQHVNWVMLDLSSDAPAVREQKCNDLIEAEARYTFDLSNEPLFRVHLLKYQQNKHVLILLFHHIIFDGWSTDIFLNELVSAYDYFNDLTDDNTVALKQAQPQLAVQYADYAFWQRKTLTEQVQDSHLIYWKMELQGAPEQIALTEKQNSDHQCGVFYKPLPAPTVKAVHQVCNVQSVTPYMYFFTAFGILLQRLSGQSDLVIGTTAANRTRQELEPMIGFFVNSLPIRLKLHQHTTFRELLSHTFKQVTEAQHHQELPFDILVKALKVERKAGVHPLFQVVFDYQHMESNPDTTPSSLQISLLPARRGQAKYPLVMSVSQTRTSFDIVLEYDQNYFDDEDATLLMDLYLNIVTESTDNPDSPLTQLSAQSGTATQSVATNDQNEEFNF